MMMQRTVTRDAQQPVPKHPATGVEAIEPLDRQEPDLLADVFRRDSITTEQVINQSKDVGDMALVHDGPGRPVARAIARSKRSSSSIVPQPR